MRAQTVRRLSTYSCAFTSPPIAIDGGKRQGNHLFSDAGHRKIPYLELPLTRPGFCTTFWERVYMTA